MPDRTLSQLLAFFGVSGKEGVVRAYVEEKIRPFVDEISVDQMGNLVAHKRGKGPKVMLAAHMDEIGLMVKRIDARGMVYCTAIGGIDPVAFIGTPVHIPAKAGRIHGVITTNDLSAGKFIKTIPTIEDIFVDTTLTRNELRKQGVEIGSYVHLESPPCCSSGDAIFGKALDNRLGCYILLEVARLLKRSPADLYFVFTVQEEFGLFGARTPAFQISPDWGIAVDTTHANDVFEDPTRWLGKGPCITIKDGEFISNTCIVDWLKATAKKLKIPYQLEALEEGTTDATVIQTTKGGIPTAVLAVPVRNIHTTMGIASMVDVRHTIRLLLELLKKPPLTCPV
ncbi:MAG: M28 family peptidase [Candidatus Aenigmarchaeota archaeon]|nr:M28 family peptidase [Candidatus Aenigmarchaeota archaeon]